MRFDIPIGEFYVTKKGKKYECVLDDSADCNKCAFEYKSKHCDNVWCGFCREDSENVIFIRRKDLEEKKDIIG